MIQRLSLSDRDKQELAAIKLPPSALADDFFDYRNVIIQKPWGHEYLIFQNKNVAIWVLHMKKGAHTSMHAHPNKKTSLTVLAGEAHCTTLTDSYRVSVGKGLIIDKGVFHSTEAIYPDEVIVMEVETPTNKFDLVRLHDAYGRTGKRYEGTEHHQPFDETIQHFHDANSRHGVEKKFGTSRITIQKHTNETDIKNIIANAQDSAIFTLIHGMVWDANGTYVMNIGDSMTVRELKQHQTLSIKEEVESLLLHSI